MFRYNTNTNKASVEQEAQRCAQEWLGQVCSKEGEWKSLADWEAQYEPPQQQQEQKTTAQSYMAAKAKQLVVNKLQRSMSSKVMKISLETSSRVLSLGETQANKKTAENQQQELAWTMLAKLLNNINAIVLTFRFEKHNVNQFRYLRRVACNELGDLLLQAVQMARDAGDTLEETRNKLTTLVTTQKDHAHAFVETALDQSLSQAAESFETKTANKIEAAKQKLQKHAPSSNKLDTTASSDDDGTLQSIDDSDSATREEIEYLEKSIQDKQQVLKDDSVSMLADVIRLIVLKKMDRLTELLVLAVNKLIDAVEKHLVQANDKLQQQGGDASLRVLQNDLYKLVERVFAQFQKRVSLEVDRAVTVLEAMMEGGGDE